MDNRWPVHLHVLLHCPFRGCICIKLLEPPLGVMGAPKGEVFHLASLSGQMLDYGAACTLGAYLLTGCPFAGTIWHEVHSILDTIDIDPPD
jgi:hypothetical protein